MILSMTGVGKASIRYGDKSITVFIKTLNSKQIDISSRLPLLYRECDLELRNLIADTLVRGKVDLSVTIDETTSSLNDVQHINYEALNHYIDELTKLRGHLADKLKTPLELEDSIDIQKLLRLPGVLVSSGEKVAQVLSDEEVLCLKELTVQAIEEVLAFRRQEGEMLYKVLLQRIENIQTLLSDVDIPEAQRIQLIRQRIEDSLEKVALDTYDKARLEQEMVYYLEKLDINEEKDRLRHHLAYFKKELNKPEGKQGRTLGFIAQEIGREINTLGSKSNSAELQQIVVKMKDELEQIKEQSLNVL